MAEQSVLIIGAGAAGLEEAEKLSAEGIKTTILEARDRIGGRINCIKIKALLSGAYFHNWREDPFSRGAYSYTPVGMIQMPELLATPIAKTLFFAGEATDATGEQGTVHGALASGKRAARELLESRTQHLRAVSPELNFKS